jgi:uncharacterized membrane protein YkgB
MIARYPQRRRDDIERDRSSRCLIWPGDSQRASAVANELISVRASMVILYFFFGYQKWFDYEAQGLIPFFTHGPLIFWMYSVFGIKVSTYFLGVSEWLFGALLLAGFWNKKLGILGALGSVVTFISTVTIIPFMPDGWAPSAGGFPAMVGNVAFLMKDVVLLAVSFYLLKQDLVRASVPIKVGCKQELVLR